MAKLLGHDGRGWVTVGLTIIGLGLGLHFFGNYLDAQSRVDQKVRNSDDVFKAEIIKDAKAMVVKHPYLMPRYEKALNNDKCLCITADEFVDLQTYVLAYESGRRAGVSGK